MIKTLPKPDDSREEWITQGDLATELQVSRTVILKRATAHPEWTPTYRKRANPNNRGEMDSRVFSPQEADILRREVREAKQRHRGPWRVPAPRVAQDIVAPATSSTAPLDKLQEISDKLDRLLHAWGI